MANRELHAKAMGHSIRLGNWYGNAPPFALQFVCDGWLHFVKTFEINADHLALRLCTADLIPFPWYRRIDHSHMDMTAANLEFVRNLNNAVCAAILHELDRGVYRAFMRR